MAARNVTIKNLKEVMAAKAKRPAVMKAQKVDGRWQRPKMSAMAIARKRKEYLKAGKSWPWDIPAKIVEKKMPFKGKKRDLQKEEKQKEIERCMKRMPKLVAEYRERERERRRARPREGRTGLARLLHEPRENPLVATREQN